MRLIDLDIQVKLSFEVKYYPILSCPQDNSPGITPDSKVHGAIMGPIWGQQDPGGSHVVPMNIAIRDS